MPNLKAILVADLVQFSTRVGRREAETLVFLQSCFGLARERCSDYGGELVKTTGDGLIAEFDSASAAVEFAIAIQRDVNTIQKNKDDKAQFRIGVHLGEVQRIGSDVYGHTVNVAARLEALAKPGGVCISQAVYQQAKRGTQFSFLAGGTPHLKHIDEPIAVYHVLTAREEALPGVTIGALRLSVFDGIAIRVSDGEALPLRSQRVRAILGYLAISTNHRETLDRLCTLIWPQEKLESARRTLNRSLRIAEEALAIEAPTALRRNKFEISLNLRAVEVDLVRIHHQATMGIVEDLLLERHDWSSVILAGLDDISPMFSSWLQVARHNWRSKITDALESCLARFDPAEVGFRQSAEALLLLEPSHELATQSLIRHHRSHGNPGAAHNVYRQLEQVLQRSFGTVPSSDTVTLISDVLREGKQLQRTPATQAPLLVPRIAVRSVSASDPAFNDYYTTGFKNELVANLSRFRDWIVFELENETTLEHAISVDYLITTNSHTSGNTQQLSVKLMDCRSRRIVWSDVFTISLETWHNVQRNLVSRIAAHLEIYLSADRLGRTITTLDGDLSAYDDWLRGEHLSSFWTGKTEDEAARLFESVIARNPSFAPAYASLAGVHNVRHLIRPGMPPDAEMERRALDLAKRAVELDPLDARNHLVVGWTSAMARQFEQSAFHYDLAVSLNPSSPKGLISAAQGMAFIGFPERAEQLLSEAMALSPILLGYQWCYVQSTRWMIGDYEGALAAAERSGNTTVDTAGWKAAALAQLGRQSSARSAFSEQIAAVTSAWVGTGPPTPESVVAWFLSAFPIARDADRAALRDALRLAAWPEAD